MQRTFEKASGQATHRAPAACRLHVTSPSCNFEVTGMFSESFGKFHASAQQSVRDIGRFIGELASCGSILEVCAALAGAAADIHSLSRSSLLSRFAVSPRPLVLPLPDRFVALLPLKIGSAKLRMESIPMTSDLCSAPISIAESSGTARAWS